MNIKFLSKISGGVKFLLFVVTGFLICAITNPELCSKIFVNLVGLLREVLPIILIVFALMFLANLFLDTKKIVKYLGHDSGVLGVVISVVFGILSAGPIYMWYPLLADFKEKGMKDSLIATFLYNRAIKIPLLPIMIYYFGLKLIIVLSFYMIIFSVINGVLVGKLLSKSLTQTK